MVYNIICYIVSKRTLYAILTYNNLNTMMMTDKRRLALFPARTIVRDPHNFQSCYAATKI